MNLSDLKTSFLSLSRTEQLSLLEKIRLSRITVPERPSRSKPKKLKAAGRQTKTPKALKDLDEAALERRIEALKKAMQKKGASSDNSN